jgi:flagellin-like protein
MKMTARRAVSPVIATLLLIAIAVAAGIIVYVYVNSLSTGLTSGGGQQVSDQVSLDAYNYKTIASGPTITVRNTGSGTVTISDVFFDGALVPTANLTPQSPANCAQSTGSITTSAACTFTITTAAAQGATSGTAHSIKIITSTGGTGIIPLTAGRSG